MLTVRKYNKNTDTDAIFEMMDLEGDWTDYTKDKAAVEKFKAVLDKDIIYVVCEGDALCGFIRVYEDHGYGACVMDLLVHKNYRGKQYGKALIEKVCAEHSGTVYVLSDNDEYYKKAGYTNIIGSVIALNE